MNPNRTGSISDIFVPINKEGYPFIIIFAVLSFLLWLIWSWLLLPSAILTLWCIYFFRDPERVTPKDANLLISPADGIIQYIGVAKLPPELAKKSEYSEEWVRISVFMNVFNVHVNRMPCNASVLVNHYHHGQFLNASFDKASDLNERQSLLLLSETGYEIGMVQIAGLVARRILCYAEEGSNWQVGARYGIIRFGSRVDLYVPKHTEILVALGQIAIGGETRLANLPRQNRE